VVVQVRRFARPPVRVTFSAVGEVFVTRMVGGEWGDGVASRPGPSAWRFPRCARFSSRASLVPTGRPR